MRVATPSTTLLGWLAVAIATVTTTEAESNSVGTLVSCPPERDVPCLWTGKANQVIDAPALRRLLLAQNDVDERDAATPLRNLQRHMDYLESACADPEICWCMLPCWVMMLVD